MREQSEDTIPILTIHVEDVTETQNILPSPGRLIGKFGQVATETLASNLSQVLKSLAKVVDRIPESCGAYDIHSFTFCLTFDTSGRVSLLGEVAAGLKSGITVTLRKGARSTLD